MKQSCLFCLSLFSFIPGTREKKTFLRIKELAIKDPRATHCYLKRNQPPNNIKNESGGEIRGHSLREAQL